MFNSPEPPKGKPKIYLRPIRKDGRYPAKYVFSFRCISKLLTQSQLDSELSSGHYDIIREN